MLDDTEQAACARCRRSTPVEQMALWTTRERVRTLARTATGASSDTVPQGGPRPFPIPDSRLERAELADAGPRPAAFRHTTVTRADGVCPACHTRLARGASLDGPERWRTWLTLGVFVAIAAALVWGVPALTPNLIAAFWRNGAGGR